MLNQTSEEQIVAAPPGAEKTPKQVLKPRKLITRTFDFLWRRKSRRASVIKREDVDIRIVECNINNTVPRKTSFSFFKNIKDHMQTKKLSECKSKQKGNEIQVSSSVSEDKTNPDLLTVQDDKSRFCTEESNESNVSEIQSESIIESSDDLNSNETPIIYDSSLQDEEVSKSFNETLENYFDVDRKLDLLDLEAIFELQADNRYENVPSPFQSCSVNQERLGYPLAVENKVTDHPIENILDPVNIDETLNHDNKVKASLTEELLKLSNYGWYWGPISGNEADAKLISEPDGAFLVRDSSDVRYVLTLSFKSSGKLLHARMEHSGGLFSFCNQSASAGFSSVADLIAYSMNSSQSAPFCYSRPRYPGQPAFPVRLTKPVSRFTQVRSLQYLCRFVIRQNTRLDNIHKLPLPKTIKGYIEEAHY
ncbi:uncharacterized protein LOC143211851 [Lasioglossum baleicum]|uniref:uncharacterized protein LOC143211851 n=1 Tax=Lasioglossum baleicum TaxID=434251 RepID=UPI003FCD0932